MDIQREGRQLALAFVNVDDIVFVRVLSSNGISLLSFAGRSLVGSAVVGAGLATRAAVLGAQVATKSALAVASAAKGRIPGAGVAEQMVYELDRNVSRSGEAASFVASQGVAVAQRAAKPPAEPIFGDPWLGKRLKPGSTPNQVLMDSALDLTRLAAMPLTLGTSAVVNALASPAGQPVMQSFWDALSAIVDSVGRRSSAREVTTADRSDGAPSCRDRCRDAGIWADIVDSAKRCRVPRPATAPSFAPPSRRPSNASRRPAAHPRPRRSTRRRTC
jgi:hypothetical protein